MASMQIDSQGSAQRTRIAELCRILGNDFTRDLASALSKAPHGSNLQLCIEGRLSNVTTDTPRNGREYSNDGNRFLMGSIKFGELPVPSPQGPNPISETQQSTAGKQGSTQHPTSLPSPVSDDAEGDGPLAHKRRKLVGGLRLKQNDRYPVKKVSESAADGECGTQSSQGEERSTSCRKAHIDTRFPQRNTTKDPAIPTLEPSSVDKLVAGIWRQIHSNVQLIPTDMATPDSTANSFSMTSLHPTLNKEAFQTVNNLCLKYYNRAQLTRALEMIVQAYWVECYEARILVIKQDNPTKSATEANMEALKEACSVFGWSEKELRNRLSVWRGYKEIKDMGGWVSVVFASRGIYRFCKYRNSFNKGLTSQLRSLRSNFEVAADTLHPKWRQLLEIIGQRSAPLYDGHPHAWVVSGGKMPQRLCSTYGKPEEFNFQFIEDSVIDTQVWRSDDPRQEPSIDPDLCPDCEQAQSDSVEDNRCRCFPNLYPRPQSAVSLQISSMANGKNNGVIARCDFTRGTAIGEFVGYITNGLNEVDVMVGGSPEKQYQIYQGQMGNFTRFINHSCRPNTQFQRFYWLGIERIIVVSRGVQAASEITVDYSSSYWEKLDKICLCGEPSCRYSNRRGFDDN